jgi:hypothetical protein
MTMCTLCAPRGLKVVNNDARWQNVLFYKRCYHSAAFRSSLILIWITTRLNNMDRKGTREK